MSTYAKQKLSGSTDGKGIKVTATAIGSGDTIHTAQSGSALDLITLFAVNNDTAAIVLTVGWGGTTSVDNEIIQTIPSKSGLVLVAADLPLTNSLVVKAAAGTANKVVIYGYVTRVT